MFYLFVVIFYFLEAFLAYGKLPLTFFQQDEWFIFGDYLYWQKASLGWFDRLFESGFTHIVPLSNFFSYIQFKLLGLSFPLYAYTCMGLQLINAWLVFLLARRLVGNKLIAFMSAGIFLVYSISHQAVTWIATTSGTVGSVTMVILSLIFFVDFIETNKKKCLFLSVLFLFISLFFKETSLFLIFFYPILWITLNKTKTFKKGLIMISPFIGMFIFYVLFRFVFLFISPAPPVETGLTQPNLFVYGYRFFSAPFKQIAQLFIPLQPLLKVSDGLIALGYPQFVSGRSVNPYISQTIGLDVISFIVSFVIIGLTFFTSHFLIKIKKSIYSTLLFISLIFVAFTSFPLVFIPGSGGYYSILDGRHLYLSSVFASIFLSLVFYAIFRSIKNKTAGIFVSLTLFLLLIGANIKLVRNDLNVQKALALTRTGILSKITSSYPKLPSKVIMFVESDTPYYGLAVGDDIVPFQSGFGQTLLVWYNQKGENFPACFFTERYLYEIRSQGYKECGGRGFGYFRKMTDLVGAIKENPILKKDVISFSYNSSSNLLTDITKDVRIMLALPDYEK